MKRFLVHVLLTHLPEAYIAKRFQELDEKMKQAGFEKIITEANGKQTELPRGVYICEDETELKRISLKAEGAAAQTWSDHSTVVTEIVGYRCFGVREFTPEV